uniref:Uncharacterized protein n=1 Tax=Anguilla anguilla TaxID=7936 RepID=A0A0E9T3E7_ANGAN
MMNLYNEFNMADRTTCPGTYLYKRPRKYAVHAHNWRKLYSSQARP